jgi:hypothetical protein
MAMSSRDAALRGVMVITPNDSCKPIPRNQIISNATGNTARDCDTQV